MPAVVTDKAGKRELVETHKGDGKQAAWRFRPRAGVVAR